LVYVGVIVGTCVFVGVMVGVSEGRSVTVGVGVSVLHPNLVGVRVGKLVTVRVNVSLRVGVGWLGLSVAVEVKVRVPVGVRVVVWEGVRVKTAEGVIPAGLCVADGVGVCDGGLVGVAGMKLRVMVGTGDSKTTAAVFSCSWGSAVVVARSRMASSTTLRFRTGNLIVRGSAL
jgi:hypothetical protein